MAFKHPSFTEFLQHKFRKHQSFKTQKFVSSCSFLKYYEIDFQCNNQFSQTGKKFFNHIMFINKLPKQIKIIIGYLTQIDCSIDKDM